jgi:hypothetical protein|tara:strand:- start:778 stop:984 length:207 start_codon:yes stop_codon:yes gene_type:complete
MDLIKFVDHFRKILKVKQNDISLYLTSGVKDWDEYKHMVGKYHAYNEMNTEINSLLKGMEHDDEGVST